MPRVYNPLKVKPFRFKTIRHRTLQKIPSHVSIAAEEPAESLTGVVQNKQASAPEERLATALDEAGISYEFRFNFGAPKPLPGWKELDFLISHGGLLYATEVDTLFTHRLKGYSDPLHDALILADKNISVMGTLYPHVFHASGDTELASPEGAKLYVKQNFGR